MGRAGLLDLDLPPGTGDTQLTLAQSFPLSGAVIVTTPQEVSLKIARRGLRMFETVHVPILGIIENMSTFICPHCSKSTDVFGHGGGERMSRQLGVPFLGTIPLDAEIVSGGDAGRPIVLEKPSSLSARAYFTIAADLAGRLQGVHRRRSSRSRGLGKPVTVSQNGWNASPSRRVLARPRSVSASAMRGRYPCSGRMGTVATSMFGTSGWLAVALSASKR